MYIIFAFSFPLAIRINRVLKLLLKILSKVLELISDRTVSGFLYI